MNGRLHPGDTGKMIQDTETVIVDRLFSGIIRLKSAMMGLKAAGVEAERRGQITLEYLAQHPEIDSGRHKVQKLGNIRL